MELLADLPWQKVSEERELDLRAAKESLDQDHYGLTKVKQRIIEYLAVRKVCNFICAPFSVRTCLSWLTWFVSYGVLLLCSQLKPDARGPVLCFVGPPGVGKTSLASSIAKALNRKFIRISLGGVKDEADIRGHRRTYIGSMPGRLIDGLKVRSCSSSHSGVTILQAMPWDNQLVPQLSLSVYILSKLSVLLTYSFQEMFF